MFEQLLTNPVLAIVVVLTAILLGKIFKLSFKILKWIILLGIAYVIVVSLGLF